MLSLLQSSEISLIDGAIKVLSDFIRDDLSDTAFPAIAPVLMPELVRVFENVEGVRGDVIGIIREFVEVIYMVKEEHPEGFIGYLILIFSKWLTHTLNQWLKFGLVASKQSWFPPARPIPYLYYPSCLNYINILDQRRSTQNSCQVSA